MQYSIDIADDKASKTKSGKFHLETNHQMFKKKRQKKEGRTENEEPVVEDNKTKHT